MKKNNYVLLKKPEVKSNIIRNKLDKNNIHKLSSKNIEEQSILILNKLIYEKSTMFS